jgi:hypothetical protein
MVCGLLAKMAVTAVLLGDPQLKIGNYDQSSVVKYCENTVVPSNANATIRLLDKNGKSLTESRIYVGQFDFYYSEKRKGGVPAKSVSFLYSYPVSGKTLGAKKLELELDGRAFRKSVALQNVVIGMK